jgi:hypothetical protein
MLVDPRTDDVALGHVMAALDLAGISDDARLEMYKQRRFGIDWGVGPSTSTAALDEEDWDVSMDRMWELCRDGGLVFVPSRNTPVDGGLIGQVPPGADVELLDYDAREEPGTVTMKTLKLHRVREVHPGDDTGLFDVVNYGHYTVHSLHEHREAVTDAYEALY